MLVNEPSTPPHRKITVQGRLEPINVSNHTSPATPASSSPSTSQNLFNFQESPSRSPEASSQSPVSHHEPHSPVSHRELRPVRVPHGNLPARAKDDTHIVRGKNRSSSVFEVVPTASSLPAARRYSIQVPPAAGYTPLQKTASSDLFHTKRRERSMSIDPRFDTCAQFIESIRKDLGNK